MKNYLKSIFLFSLLFFNCQSNDDHSNTTQLATIASETTIENAEITFTSLKIYGNVTSDGGGTITERGVCWSTNTNPTITDEISLSNMDTFSLNIENLVANTNYYFRVFVTNEYGTNYGPELTFKTLSLVDTNWTFTTYYSEVGDFSILSEINFYDDQTTRFDELDLPGQCPGCFITYGSWILDGNNVTYIWNGDDPSNSTYVYTGTLSALIIEGTYTHQTASDGVWSAIIE